MENDFYTAAPNEPNELGRETEPALPCMSLYLYAAINKEIIPHTVKFLPSLNAIFCRSRKGRLLNS